MNPAKIVIGTANFGNKYNLKDSRGLRINEIEKILNFAYKNKIRKIDTAQVYGNSEKILGTFGLKKWKVSTKIQLRKKIKDYKSYILSCVNRSLNNLKIDCLDNLLIHNELSKFNKKESIEIIDTLKKLKKEKMIKNFGCSIYSPKDLYDSTKFCNIDIIQAPANVFDRRFLDKKIKKYLKKEKIKLQIRSIFLKGLLLYNFDNFPKKFKYWKDDFKKYQIFLKKIKLNKITGALSILNKLEYDSVVIGFDSYKEFKEILRNIPDNNLLIPNFNIRKRNKIIDPRKW